MEQELELLKGENKELQEKVERLEDENIELRDALDTIYRITKQF